MLGDRLGLVARRGALTRRRSLSTPARADVIVVGAGPAGVVAVGSLLAQKLRVLWVDDRFDGGALAHYRDVPANTKVDILAAMRTTDFLPGGLPIGSPAAAVMDEMATTAHAIHMEHDPATVGWTGLDRCHDFFGALTESLRKDGRCTSVVGRVGTLRLAHGTGGWHARLHGAPPGAFSLVAPSVVLATGAVESTPPDTLAPSAWSCAADGRSPRVVPLVSALQLEQLRALVAPHETVGIVGGGHTGLVVARHLVEALRVKSTMLFVRRPIRLAQWDANAGAYGSWAFRGLKGAAAHFALRQGLVDVYPPPNGLIVNGSAPGLELHDSRALSTCRETSARVDAVVYCLGFGEAPVPTILRPGTRTEDAAAALAPEGRVAAAEEDVAVRVGQPEVPGGALRDADGMPLKGLYGVGLGFADAEYTSGAAYAEAGFMPFAVRAQEIAMQVARFKTASRRGRGARLRVL